MKATADVTVRVDRDRREVGVPARDADPYRGEKRRAVVRRARHPDLSDRTVLCGVRHVRVPGRVEREDASRRDRGVRGDLQGADHVRPRSVDRR